MSLVSLSLDDKDKENFTELQQSIGQAQQELAQLTNKLRVRVGEAKHSQLTLAELETVPDETRAFAQVGKMFLLQSLAELKKELTEKVESCTKDVAAMTEKKTHARTRTRRCRRTFRSLSRRTWWTRARRTRRRRTRRSRSPDFCC